MAAQTGEAKLERIPYDTEMELWVIGACLISSVAVASVVDKIKPEHFFSETHSIMFEAIVNLHDDGHGVDRKTLTHELKRMGKFDYVGGVKILRRAMESPPGSANATGHAHIVRELAARRRAMDAADRLKGWSTDLRRSLDETLADVAGMLEGARTTGDDGGLDGCVDLGEVLRGGVQPPEELVADVLLAGKAHQIFAPPGEGKSWMAGWLSLQVARQRKAVLYLDAENGPATIAGRMQALGATDAELSAYVHYHSSPTITLEPGSVAAYMRTLDAASPAVMVVDSWVDYIALAGIEENDPTGVTLWWHTIIGPALQRGVAIVLLDHVPVNATSPRGRGTGAKLGKVDVSWQLQKVHDFDAHRVGQVDLIRRKLRHGELPRRVNFVCGGGEAGMVFRRADGVVEEPDPMDGLTDSQREALATLQGLRTSNPSGTTYTDWMRVSGLAANTFDRARQALLGQGLVRRSGQRYLATFDHGPALTAAGTHASADAPHGGNSGGTGGEEGNGFPYNNDSDTAVGKPDSSTPIYPHATPTGVNGGSVLPSTPTTPTTRKGGGSGGKEPEGDSGTVAVPPAEGSADSDGGVADLQERLRARRDALRRERKTGGGE